MTGFPSSGGPVERGELEDLAAASRVLADQGVFDAAGHVSMRHPRHAERFLMSRSLAPALVTADDIMEFTLACEACEAPGRQGFIERFLHAGIYRARPDVMAVAHGHSPSVIPFGLVATPMRATYHNAAFLAAGVPVFDIRATFGATDIVINSAERGAALAETLGDNRSCSCEPTASRPSGRACRLRCSAASSPRSARACSCRRRPSEGRWQRSMRTKGAWPTRSIWQPTAARGSSGEGGSRREAAARRCDSHAGARRDHRPQWPLQRPARHGILLHQLRGVGARHADRGRSRHCRSRRPAAGGQRPAAARVSHPLRGVSRSARRQCRDAHASAMVHVSHDGGGRHTKRCTPRACCSATFR